MTKSPDAEGCTVSHEAIYRRIYALPKGELAKSGILLQSTRTKCKSVKSLGERTGGRIIGMVSIDDRPEEAADRRVPRAWAGDLVVGKGGKSATATLVEIRATAGHEVPHRIRLQQRQVPRGLRARTPRVPGLHHRAQDLVLYGDVGIGKTHMASALVAAT